TYGRPDDQEEQEPEAAQPALVQRRLRDDQLVARAVQQAGCAAGRRVRARPCRRRQVVLRGPRSGGAGVHAAAALRLDEQGPEVPLQPAQGEVAAEKPRPEPSGERGLLVPHERLAAVLPEPRPELPGFL